MRFFRQDESPEDAMERKSGCIGAAVTGFATGAVGSMAGMTATHFALQRFSPSYRKFNWRPKLWALLGFGLAYASWSGETAMHE